MLKVLRFVVAALICVGGGAVPQALAQTGQDVVTQYRPYPCGGKGTRCVVGDTYTKKGDVNTDQVSVLSYGAAGSYLNIFVSGIDELDCDAYNGNHVDNFECVLQPVSLPKVAAWNTCAVSGGWCTNSYKPNQFRLVRYGDGKHWVYFYVGSYFQCPSQGSPAKNINGTELNVKTGKLDPGLTGDRTSTKCQVSSDSFPGTVGAVWTTCATKDTDCVFPGAGSYLVRYGAEDANGAKRFIYRVANGNYLRCSDALGRPSNPDEAKPRCDYLELPKIASIQGGWEVAGLCENCTNVNYDVTVGVVKGTTKERESSWFAEVSVSQSVEISSVSAEVSASASWAGRDLMANSFSLSKDNTLSVTCDLGVLWQWVTRAESFCLPSASSSECLTIAKSKMFQCLRPGEDPGDAELATQNALTVSALSTTDETCLAKWREFAGLQPAVPSGVAAKALNIAEYKLDPDGDYQITYRNWTFMCPSLLAN